MEFELHGNGTLRYANNSQYKNAKMIRKEGQSQQALVSIILSEGCQEAGMDHAWIKWCSSQSVQYTDHHQSEHVTRTGQG
jgi:hypothetical protein